MIDGQNTTKSINKVIQYFDEEEQNEKVKKIVYITSKKQKTKLSIEEIDFNNHNQILSSPRSLEACKQLGILPKELYFQSFNDYYLTHPEIMGLTKEIQKMRYDHVEKVRQNSIELIKEKRIEIIKDECKNQEEKIEENEKVVTFEKQMNDIIKKEKQNIDKLKRRQKNEIK